MTDEARKPYSSDSLPRVSASELLPLVYDELKRLAAARLAREQPGQTLQATALVHEAYMKLAGADSPREFHDRGHFFATAAEAMRQILVDAARRKLSAKRGGKRTQLPEAPQAWDEVADPAETLALNELLERFAGKYPRPAQVANMRVYLQMTFVEIGAALSVSSDTAEGDWAFARAWLKREWKRADSPGE